MRHHRARDTIGRFTLVREIGRGGAGIVYEALEPETERRLALKVLRTLDDPALLVRFKREFRLVKMLAHPNIVALEELFSEDNEWFFTMELVGGLDFLTFARHGLAPGGPNASSEPNYSESRLRKGLVQLVSALEVMHEAGIAHRDVKPSNVLVTQEGRLVVLDFGVATDLRARATGAETLSIVGTPVYMAPELALGEASGVAVDLYAVGVMLFEALTGHRPVNGAVMEVLSKKLTEPVRRPHELVASVPKDLSQLAMDLLEPDPQARPTASEVLQRLGVMSATFTGELTGEGSSRAKKTHVFVGRESELAALEGAFAETRSGGSATVVVRGESGIGKTALVTHSLAKLEERAPDVVILNGRCRENEWIPFKAVDGLMDDLARVLGAHPQEAKAILPRRADRLAQVFPIFRRVVKTSAHGGQGMSTDPVEQRSQLFGSVRELFQRLCEQYAVVALIDDVQWADADSLAILNELTRPPDAPLLTLIVTLRSEGANEPLKEPAFGRARVIDLTRLSIEDSVALAREMALGDNEPPTSERAPFDAETIAREAHGHPMFIAELVRYSAVARPESGLVRLDDALGERLRALDAASAAVLRLIALTGRPTTLALVKEASSLGFDEVTRIVAHLRGIHVLRASRTRGDLIEPYHDRVREVVLKALTEDHRREFHRRIATALESANEPDAEALALHWRGAGDEDRALSYGLKAAQAASEALAFDHAAELYESALASSRLGRADERLVAEKLGDALVNAGRGIRAAAAYRRAARGAPVANALDLERRAAEQLLRAGHFDEGLDAIRAVLAAVGMSLPKTPIGALVRFVFGRLVLHFRGLGFKRRDETQIPATELVRADVCRSVSFGLAVVDTVRAAAFQVRALLLALRAGEIKRVAFALAYEATFIARAGEPSFQRAVQLGDRACALADETGDPNTIAWSLAMRGTADYLCGRFADALDRLQRAVELWRTHCSGVAWELASSQLFAASSLAQMGAFRRLSEELPRALRDALERGDRYGAVCLRVGMPNLHWLALDAPLEAETQVREAMSEWSKLGFHLEHFYELIALTNVDLYRGHGRAAYARIEQRWGALRRSLLPFTIQSVRILSRHARARSALRAAEEVQWDPALLRAAERDARALQRERSAISVALASLVRAALAATGGAEARAAALLRDAISGFDVADMKLHAAAARRRLGTLLGGEEGRTLASASDAWMASEGVKNPERLVAMIAPGFAARKELGKPLEQVPAK